MPKRLTREASVPEDDTIGLLCRLGRDVAGGRCRSGIRTCSENLASRGWNGALDGYPPRTSSSQSARTALPSSTTRRTAPDLRAPSD